MPPLDNQILALIWLALGVVLILAEFIIPGLIVIFFGTSALVVAVLTFFGMDLWLALLCFSAMTLLQVFFFRKLLQGVLGYQLVSTDIDDDEYTGKEATACGGFKEPYLDRGQVTFHGATWTAKLENPPSRPVEDGEILVITGRRGLTLLVTRPGEETEAETGVSLSSAS